MSKYYKKQDSRLYTVEEACKILKVSRMTIYRWIKKGWIVPVILPSGRLRIPHEEVQRLLEKEKVAT
ncbi:MAG: hypothetical protein DSO07_05250 [Thermoproteota archaeon]|nr:MAG: hypothetical protein DSO07_05250 [Candidatus Korarchaeota archaeon]